MGTIIQLTPATMSMANYMRMVITITRLNKHRRIRTSLIPIRYAA
ncbi:hypothetical protein [Noviherbaspirillum sp.]